MDNDIIDGEVAFIIRIYGWRFQNVCLREEDRYDRKRWGHRIWE